MVVNEGDTVVLDCQPFVDRQNFRATLSLRWLIDGIRVNGQTTVNFTIDRVNKSSEGTYRCLVQGRRSTGIERERQSRNLVVRGNNI